MQFDWVLYKSTQKRRVKVLSKRVTIAVPESLFERLQPVKNHLNISAICQEAIDMAITHEKIKQQYIQDECLVERLRTEKQVLLKKVQQEGYELGIRSASKLSYKDFQHFERVRPLAASLDEDVLEYLWTYLDSRGYPEAARIHDADFAHLLEVSPQSRVLFSQGWIDGVLSVWTMIKEQVETED
jgi:post-segregation antitoxin (ccd killing protein)